MAKSGILFFAGIALVGCRPADNDLAGNASSPDSNFSGQPIKNSAADNVSATTALPDSGATDPACSSIKKVADNDQIGGIYLGMLADDAYVALSCAEPGLELRWANRTMPEYRYVAYPDGSEPRQLIISDNRGNTAADQFMLQLAGPPGDERVVGIGRILRFNDQNSPTVANMDAEIGRKFKFSSPPVQNRNSSLLVYSRGISSCSASLYDVHLGTAPASRLGCPKVVAVSIEPQANNPILIKEVVFLLSDGALAERLVRKSNEKAKTAWDIKRTSDTKAASDRPINGL